ncbi:S1C family serine protease [Natranaerobius thermophilus]|uniref:2-alkenal reductase n=1 Tax=Natranaerobius thermophilus (strain ATCC BAA-1301 / DSM 18059 / JW/NM-WN-LF) TaxID=457570 RepID=B2A3L3_NATTJ|nr:trypsin-like peptidase domain-containing protein [Natranaerobius thermophilus]ACB86442.1 2-alkenal reductase [Natranaerobius thermophilus JW/NM-WN-LF]
MSFYKRQGPSFVSIIIVALLSAIIGGVLTAIILPPAVAGRLETEMKESPQKEAEQSEPNSDEEDHLFWEDIDPEEYQDTPVVRAAQEVMPAVVGVTNRAQAWDQTMDRGTGSGVVIEPEGLIVTNYHVIEAAEEVVVTIEEGKSAEAEIVGEDPETDLAVLEVDPQNFDKEELHSAEFGDSDELVAGEMTIAIGNPLGLAFQQSVTAGVISATDRKVRVGEDYISLIQTDAAINPGNSGGPLVNALGEVIGINSVKIRDAGVEGMGFAIPSNRVSEIVEDLIEYGFVERPWIGIYIQEIDPYIAEIYNLPVNYGIFIQEIEPNSPAAEAGMQRGDILIEFAGEQIDSQAKLRNVRNDYDVGDNVEVTVLREGEEITLDMTLEGDPRLDQ